MKTIYQIYTDMRENNKESIRLQKKQKNNEMLLKHTQKKQEQIQHHLGFGSFFHSIQIMQRRLKKKQKLFRRIEKNLYDHIHMYNMVTFGKQNKTKKERERFATKIRR